MSSYRRHAVSKMARQQHKRRDQRAKRAARKAGGMINPFAYQDIRGKSRKRLAARMGRVR